MSFFKICKNFGLISILMMCSITVHANWPQLILDNLDEVARANDLFRKAAESKLLSILKRLNIKREDLPEEVFEELKYAIENPSRLFYYRGFRKIKEKYRVPLDQVPPEYRHTAENMRDYDWESPHFDVSQLLNYRSAIEVLQSDIHRAFFFSLFDPLNSDHVEGLLKGLRVHRVSHTEIGFDEVVEIADFIQTNNMWDDWILFRGMAKQAISDEHLKVEIVDIEAAFISTTKQREFPLESYRSAVVEDSFWAFTDELVSRAEKSGKLVDLYRSPYCNLPLRSPYREKLLSALQKSDLSDKDLILKWWQDVSYLPGGRQWKGKKELLKTYIKEAFNSAKRGRTRGRVFDEKAFMEDPFISKLMEATKENENLGEAVREVLDSLSQTFSHQSGHNVVVEP